MNAEVELTTNERVELAGWQWNFGCIQKPGDVDIAREYASGWFYRNPGSEGSFVFAGDVETAAVLALDAWGIPRTRPAPVAPHTPGPFRPFKMDSNEWVNDGLAPIRLTPEKRLGLHGWRARVTVRCPGGHRFSVWAPTPAEAVASAVARLRKYAFFANAAANHLEDLAATGCPEVTQ